MHSDLGFSAGLLGWMDFAYVFSYGIGNFFAGPLGDRCPLRLTIPVGMWLAACIYLVAMAMGFEHVTLFAPFVVIWVFNGLFQSTVWSGTVAVMGNWFSKKHRGKIMGPWSSNASVGDIIGSMFSGLMLALGVRWEYITMSAALFMIVIGVFFFFLVTDHPPKSLMEGSCKSHAAYQLKEELQPFDDVATSSFHQKTGISFIQAVLLPGVILYALDYAMVKLLNYGMMFWLPYYLDKHVKMGGLLIGVVTALYDTGAVFGSSVAGWLSDRLGSRVLVVTPMLIIGLPVFYCFSFGSKDTYWIYFILVPGAGFTISAAANIISGAVAVDLAKNETVKISTESLATVAAILDGTGSLGAACGEVIIGYLSQVGWDSVFYFLMGVNAVAFVLLIAYFLRDIKLKTWSTKSVKPAKQLEDTNLE